MPKQNIRHKVATENQEQGSHEKNGHKHQHLAENDGEETKLLRPHFCMML